MGHQVGDAVDGVGAVGVGDDDVVEAGAGDPGLEGGTVAGILGMRDHHCATARRADGGFVG